MTVTVTVPADLESLLLARAAANGRNLSDAIIHLLREVAGPSPARLTAPIPRLEPSVYPEEEIGEDLDYQAVPFPTVGTVTARFVTAGQLTPSIVPDTE